MLQRILYAVLIIQLLFIAGLRADGLLMPVNEDYPKDFLRHRLTRISVKLSGQIARTIVYQEFVNEWHQATDAVYSFPLPPDARATDFFYWYNETLYQAVLKVKEQAVNPGTGEGGIAALVNEYIGRNGIKISLKNILPGEIQKVELHYISQTSYYQGQMTYEFPLDTRDFLTYPIDLLSVDLDLEANSPIQSCLVPSHNESEIHLVNPYQAKVNLDLGKTYLNKNFEFKYSIPNDSLSVDFYSVANDTIDGHFVLLVNPGETVDPANILNKRVIFLIDNSSSMLGYKLEQSKEAIIQCLALLNENDFFNILIFNYYTHSWKSQLVQATSLNIQEAESYLNSISTGSGSDLHNALSQAISQIPDKSLSNSILLFTDGFSAVDPKVIEQDNIHKTGIFSIGIGDKLDRAKLELTSLLNYGFVTYFSETDNLITGITRVFNQIDQPVLMDTNMEFGQSYIYDTLPVKFPTLYQGHRFFLTGRYKYAGISPFSIAGYSTRGIEAFDFDLDFSNDTREYRFAEDMWAKEKIDDIERQIAVYGETDSLKQLDIEMSLRYNIRCKYTAYIADYTTQPTDVTHTEEINIPESRSFIVTNYPNPFNAGTNIRFFLGDDAANVKEKFIRIYNILGQLIAVIDISHLTPGMHTLKLNSHDLFGSELPSGIYLCQLIVGKNRSTIRINYIK